MTDNTLKIGSEVDVATLRYGLDASADATKEALDKLLVSFQDASTGTARAVSKIADDTKAAATTVSNEWKRAAEASLNYNAALKEVSAASYLARKAGEDDAVATNLLAAAKQKAALAATELKEAELALVPAANEAAASEGLLGGAVGEFVGELVTLEIIRRTLENAANFNLQMRNLSATTGISAQTLAGLHDVVNEAGGDFNAVSVGLTKMLKSQQDAIDGSKKQIDGFHRIGIEVSELRNLTPEELFFRIADGFQTVGSSAEKNAAAVEIFGRGGRNLIPVFEGLGAKLREHVQQAGEVSGVTNKNIEDSQKFKQVTDELSVAMRSFGSSAIPYVLAGLHEIGALLEADVLFWTQALDFLGALVVSVAEGVVGLGKILLDVSTGNFKDVANDAIALKESFVNQWKGAANDLKGAWKDVAHAIAHPLDALIKDPINPITPPAPGTDLPGGPTNDKQLQDWRLQLQQKKDAEDGFHELSKADEAKFWQDKLSLAQGNAKLYAEVYHLMRDAERASQKESLKAEADTTRELLAGAKQGSQERVIILSEELNYLKSIGADQTQEAKNLQTQLAAATREYAEQQGKAAVEVERQKVEATRKGSEERVAAERNVLNQLTALGLQETAEYTKQLQRVNEAERQAAQERLKLKELDIEQERITGTARVDVARQNVQAEYDLHLISARQRIAALKALEDEEYEIIKAAMEKKLELMLQDPTLSPTQIKALQNQIENLTREHNTRIAALDTQAAKDSMQKFDQLFQHITQGFSSAVTGMLNGSKSFSKGMQDMWNSIASGFIQSLVKMLVGWVQHETAKLIVHTTTNESIVASDASAAAQSQQISLITALKHIAHAAAAAGAHAFKSVMENVPFPINVALAPVAAAGAFAGVMAFGSFASAREGMVSQEEQLAFIHKNEMVLPASLSLGFQSIIGGISSGAGAPAFAGAGAGGGGSEVNFHGGINYSPTYHSSRSPQQDPNVIATMVRRRIAKQTGFSLR